MILLANVALALEYEAVCLRAEHIMAAGLTQDDALVFVDAVIAMLVPVDTYFIWRPRLRDAEDEFVLEAAVNGGAAAIVTFNLADFGSAPGEFGVEVLTPAAAVRRIRS